MSVRILCRSEHSSPAAGCYRRALRIARSRGARSLELRAATSPARLRQKQGRGAQAREALGEVYGRLSEGFDTQNLREARMVLEGR